MKIKNIILILLSASLILLTGCSNSRKIGLDIEKNQTEDAMMIKSFEELNLKDNSQTFKNDTNQVLKNNKKYKTDIDSIGIYGIHENKILIYGIGAAIIYDVEKEKVLGAVSLESYSLNGC